MREEEARLEAVRLRVARLNLHLTDFDGGLIVVDPRDNGVVFGREEEGESATLDEVEEWLTSREP